MIPLVSFMRYLCNKSTQHIADTFAIPLQTKAKSVTFCSLFFVGCLTCLNYTQYCVKNT